MEHRSLPHLPAASDVRRPFLTGGDYKERFVERPSSGRILRRTLRLCAVCACLVLGGLSGATGLLLPYPHTPADRAGSAAAASCRSKAQSGAIDQTTAFFHDGGPLYLDPQEPDPGQVVTLTLR